MSSKLKKAWPKILAAAAYCMTHKKQLTAAYLFGMAVLEAAQKAH